MTFINFIKKVNGGLMTLIKGSLIVTGTTMGQVRTFGRIRFRAVPLNEIQNISFDHDNSIGVMKLMLSQDAVTVGMSQETAAALSEKLAELLPVIQELARQLCADSDAAQTPDQEDAAD